MRAVRRKIDVVAVSLLGLSVLGLTAWRIAFVLAGPDLDTDAYGHHSIARRLADHPGDFSAHWVWLPLFHYAQALAVRLGATLDSVRIFDALVTAATPFILYAFLRRRSNSTPDEGHDAAPFLAAALCALSPLAMQMGTTGQTEPLFTLGTLVCITCLDTRRWTATALVLSALVLLRYEAWAILPAIVTVQLFDHWMHRRSIARVSLPPGDERPASSRWIVTVVLPALAILCWAALRRRADGGQWFWFLRATKDFAHEAQGIHGALDRGVRQLGKDLAYYPVVVPFAVLGWPFLLAPFGAIRTLRREGSRFVFVYLFILAFITWAWLTRSSLGLYRHLTVLVPFYCTLIANGIVAIARAAERIAAAHRNARIVRQLVVSVFALGALALTYRMLESWMADWRDKARTYWPDRRAIAAYLRETPPSTRIFCDEPMIEVLSGVDRRRFDRAPIFADEPTKQRVLDAAARDGEAWVTSYPSHLGTLQPFSEVKIPSSPPATSATYPAAEALLLRVPAAATRP
jgi:4-amino-4-deoxy-L-arabinose transferase-like glycosyltransferase